MTRRSQDESNLPACGADIGVLYLVTPVSLEEQSDGLAKTLSSARRPARRLEHSLGYAGSSANDHHSLYARDLRGRRGKPLRPFRTAKTNFIPLTFLPEFTG